jgi:thymidine kinase
MFKVFRITYDDKVDFSHAKESFHSKESAIEYADKLAKDSSYCMFDCAHGYAVYEEKDGQLKHVATFRRSE